MADPREQVRDRLHEDVGVFETLGHLDPVDDAELEATLDAYELDLLRRLELFGEVHVVADLLARLFRRRGTALYHSRSWADTAGGLAELAERVGVDEQHVEQARELDAESKASAPTDYDALLPQYLALADSLDDPTWRLDGDHRSGAAVRLTVRHGGTQFETALEAGQEVDVDGLVTLLNRVVETTTDDDRRYVADGPWTSFSVRVFFVDDATTLRNYFGFAVEDTQRRGTDK